MTAWALHDVCHIGRIQSALPSSLEPAGEFGIQLSRALASRSAMALALVGEKWASDFHVVSHHTLVGLCIEDRSRFNSGHSTEATNFPQYHGSCFFRR